jgi:hypothetical protein
MTIYPQKFCVYAHSINGQIIYIGKGRGYRSCESRARTPQWIEAVQNAGFFDVTILEWFEQDQDAKKFEALQIHKFKPLGNLMHNGLTRSINHKLAMSRAVKGICKSELTRAKMSAARFGKVPVNKGQAMSAGQKQMLSEQAQKRIAIVETKSGQSFPSVRAASKQLGIAKTTLLQHLQGKLKHAHGMTFRRMVL